MVKLNNNSLFSFLFQPNWEYVWQREILSVRALHALKAGDEITIYYGPKCNSELLDYYGYIIPSNPNDCVHIEVDIKESDPLAHAKKILLKFAEAYE